MENEKISEAIANFADMARMRLDTARSDLTSKAMQDPTYAIEHHSARLVRLAFEYHVWQTMTIPAANDAVKEAIAHGRRRCMIALTGRGRSTCPFARAVAETQREAAAGLLDEIRQLENLLD